MRFEYLFYLRLDVDTNVLVLVKKVELVRHAHLLGSSTRTWS